ncbi:MAG TPA: hypothetical protein VGN98_02015 [Tianweitania sediminis]|nr:hypothetical protein [Tianweitania sediminis]
MKNKLTDLNDHLFMQLERLGDEDLTSDQIVDEAKRSRAMVAVADQIISNARLHLETARLASEYGSDPTPHLKMIEGKANG